MAAEKGIIYNVTVQVEKAIAPAWLQWMLQEHIPAIMSTECFTSYQVVQLLDVDDSEGPTYAIQYTAATFADYQKYITQLAAAYHQQAVQKWGQQFVFFATAMQVVS